MNVVPPGIEPGTHGFSVRCSTNWAMVPRLMVLQMYETFFNPKAFFWKIFSISTRFITFAPHFQQKRKEVCIFENANMCRCGWKSLKQDCVELLNWLTVELFNCWSVFLPWGTQRSEGSLWAERPSCHPEWEAPAKMRLPQCGNDTGSPACITNPGPRETTEWFNVNSPECNSGAKHVSPHPRTPKIGVQ